MATTAKKKRGWKPKKRHSVNKERRDEEWHCQEN